MRTMLRSAAIALALVGTASAQMVNKDGVVVGRGMLGQKVELESIKTFHPSEFKGAHRVAIASFAVAFPSENHYFAAARGGGLGALMGGGQKRRWIPV